MRIVILGWGSLIREKGELPLKTDWKTGSPYLPVEFSRISTTREGALTLVIDPKNGINVPTRYAESIRIYIEDAICDLRCREGTVVRRIGFVNLVDGTQRCNVYPEAANVIRKWASDNNLDAVIWTDLPSNFKEETQVAFSVGEALKYLKKLPKTGARKAREYFSIVPEDVQTPLRRRINDDPWLIEEG